MRVSIKSDLEALGKQFKKKGPKAIATASRVAINDTASEVTVGARADLVKEVDPVLKNPIKRLVQLSKATARNGRKETSALIYFHEKGIGVENKKTSKIIRVRAKRGKGASGRWNVTLRGQGTLKAFKLGADKKKNSPTYIRSKGKLKRLFSHTASQSVIHAKIHERASSQAPQLFIKHFIHLIDITEELNKTRRRGVNSSGRRR